MEIWKKRRIVAFDQQVQVGVDVGETFVTNVNRIEVELQKTIDMIEEQ